MTRDQHEESALCCSRWYLSTLHCARAPEAWHLGPPSCLRVKASRAPTQLRCLSVCRLLVTENGRDDVIRNSSVPSSQPQRFSKNPSAEGWKGGREAPDFTVGGARYSRDHLHLPLPAWDSGSSGWWWAWRTPVLRAR